MSPSEAVLPGSPAVDARGPAETAGIFPFESTYTELPTELYSPLAPTPVRRATLAQLNEGLAEMLGLDAQALRSSEGVGILAGNRVQAASQPLALTYAGHQFGYWVPQLGDGRALLLGEVVARNGQRFDVQLKGSGPTPYSRRGDGRAALAPVLREYIVSEAMAALGVPTTRALAAVSTGEAVLREVAVPGGVLTRVAASHLRVGTFQYLAARGDADALQALLLYALRRHYPEASEATKPARALLDGVVGRQARLMAQWMLVGFIHGVMNTDNMSISGETIDYGPCAFMENYDLATVFSSIDSMGRYSFGNQPNAAHWNLARLAEALLPSFAREEGTEEAGLASATDTLATFEPQFTAAFEGGLLRKVGIAAEEPGDSALLVSLLERMSSNEVDFTLFFRRLCDAATTPAGDSAVRLLFNDPNAFDSWAVLWRARLASEPIAAEERAARMRQANPAYIPRNHQVERALRAASQVGDFAPFRKLLEVTARPFEERSGLEAYLLPAAPEERVLQTFCGT